MATAVPLIKMSNGSSIPALGFGTWKAEPGVVGASVKIAIAEGFRHIDCAEGYGNEKEIGEALKEVFAEGKVKREDLFITSKIWGSNFDIVEKRLKNSLTLLQIDYLDLYLLHCPSSFERTPEGGVAKDSEDFPKRGKTPIHMAWADMEKMVDAGLTKAIGVSNFSSLLINDMLSYARIPPAVNQIEVSPYYTNEALAQWCLKVNVQVTAYCPLGVSAGVSICDEALKTTSVLQDELIVAIAKKHNATAAQVLLKWSIQKGYNVLSKSTKEHRIKENFSSRNVVLTDEEVKQITGLNKNWKVCNHATEFGVPVYN